MAKRLSVSIFAILSVRCTSRLMAEDLCLEIGRGVIELIDVHLLLFPGTVVICVKRELSIDISI